MEIRVNGQVVNASLSFPATGSGNTWTYITIPQQALQAGANTIQVKVINTGTALNMDHLLLAPLSQRIVYYNYDSHNRLSTVTDWYNRVTTYTYDLAGRVTEILRPGGTKRKITYNEAGETTLIEELKADGNYVNYFKFSYDTGGRMKDEFIAPIPAAFTEPTHTMTHNADNQIATFNGQTVVHDADGNMTSGPLDTSTPVAYTYDARNRLTSAGGITYTYDSEGNRITLTQSGQTTRFVVNPNASLSQALVRTRPDGTKTYYVYGAGLLYDVETTTAGAETGVRHNYHYDYRGSTVAMTDGTGAVLERVEYSIYGQITRRVGTTVDTPFLYNGMYGVMTDPNGLYSMRARYYNAYIRRFLNADPSGFSGGLNFYAAFNGNPVMYVDPEGHLAWFVTGGIGAGIGAIVGGVAAAWDNDPRTTVWGGIAGGAVSGAFIGSGAGLLAAAGGTALSATGVGVLAGSGVVGEFAGGTVQQRIEVATGYRNQVDYGEIAWNAAISGVTTPAFGIIGEGVGEIAQVAAGRSMAGVIQNSAPVVAGFEAAYDLPRASGRLLMSYGDDVLRAGQTWRNIGIGTGIGVDDFYGEVAETIFQSQLPQPRTWLGAPTPSSGK